MALNATVDFLQKNLNALNLEEKYGKVRKIKDALNIGSRYKFVNAYKIDGDDLKFNNDAIVLREVGKDVNITVYGCSFLKRIYGDDIKNVTTELINALESVEFKYNGQVNDKYYKFTIIQ